jgi:hypothetical protein
MTDAWITSTMPPTAGVYDVTIQVGAGRLTKRATASAYWPGRRSKRWQLLDMSIPDGLVVAWSARRVPYAGSTPRRPMGIVCPVELED